MKEGTIALSVGFVAACAAFLREKLGLQGNSLIGAAFVVSLLVAFMPMLMDLVPKAAPYIDTLLKVLGIFISAIFLLRRANARRVAFNFPRCGGGSRLYGWLHA